MARNGFEEAGRARKVMRLLGGVDKLAAQLIPGADDDRIAAWLERCTRDDRARVAVLCGVILPSDKTWAALIDAVRERKAIGDRFGDGEEFIK